MCLRPVARRSRPKSAFNGDHDHRDGECRHADEDGADAADAVVDDGANHRRSTAIAAVVNAKGQARIVLFRAVDAFGPAAIRRRVRQRLPCRAGSQWCSSMLVQSCRRFSEPPSKRNRKREQRTAVQRKSPDSQPSVFATASALVRVLCRPLLSQRLAFSNGPGIGASDLCSIEKTLA
jgi:hypothetical protein